MTSAATAETTLTQPPVKVDSRARFEILGAVMLALFLSALDQTIVGPILPASSPTCMASTTTPGWSLPTC